MIQITPDQSVRRPMQGQRVSITGRMASMNRDEAVQLIRELGGQYVREPGLDTHVLVVGQEDCALGDDGELTGNLKRAHDLNQRGAKIEIVAEEEFLSSLGLEDHQQRIHHLYTTAQLSRILGVSGRRIRSWVRHGLIRPEKIVHRLCYFRFQQVALAKTLCELTSSGITPSRLRSSLEQLQTWVPAVDEVLAQLGVLEKGGPLLVRLDDGRLAETSGQLQLDFDTQEQLSDTDIDTEEPASNTISFEARVRELQADQEPSDRARHWFEQGLDLEDRGRLEDAVRAYIQALNRGYVTAEIFFNLGNLCYQLDHNEQALVCFQRATEEDPDYVEAWNNIGSTHSELGDLDQAIQAYEHALSIDPLYADAHYNLGSALEQLGRDRDAHRHWLSYLRLDPYSTWAQEVRERLM